MNINKINNNMDNIEKNEHIYNELKNKLLQAEASMTEMSGLEEIKG